MRVLLSTIGSRGDVQPLVALALQLRELGQEVRICEYTNYCEALDQKHKQVTCQLWDKDVVEQPGTHKGRRRRLIAPSWSPKADAT